MGEILFLIFFGPVMGYLAVCKGRSFWLWFWIGTFLPVISMFILFALKEKPVIINPDDLVVYKHNDKVLYKKPEE